MEGTVHTVGQRLFGSAETDKKTAERRLSGDGLSLCSGAFNSRGRMSFESIIPVSLPQGCVVSLVLDTGKNAGQRPQSSPTAFPVQVCR